MSLSIYYHISYIYYCYNFVPTIIIYTIIVIITITVIIIWTISSSSSIVANATSSSLSWHHHHNHYHYIITIIISIIAINITFIIINATFIIYPFPLSFAALILHFILWDHFLSWQLIPVHIITDPFPRFVASSHFLCFSPLFTAIFTVLICYSWRTPHLKDLNQNEHHTPLSSYHIILIFSHRYLHLLSFYYLHLLSFLHLFISPLSSSLTLFIPRLLPSASKGEALPYKWRERLSRLSTGLTKRRRLRSESTRFRPHYRKEVDAGE